MSPHLTELAIRKLEVTPGKRIELWDSKVPGFGMRVTPTGARSFVLMYRVNGHQHRMTLGQYPILTLAKAREKAITALQQVGDGIDPNPTKEDSSATRSPRRPIGSTRLSDRLSLCTASGTTGR